MSLDRSNSKKKEQRKDGIRRRIELARDIREVCAIRQNRGANQRVQRRSSHRDQKHSKAVQGIGRFGCQVSLATLRQ